MEREQEKKLKLLVNLAVALSILSASTGAAEYVRPQPRKTLDFSRKPKLSPSFPQQVHISLAGDKHVRVSWVTDDKDSPSYVEYGMSPGKYEHTTQGESTSYSYLLYSSGKIHHVVIGPLEDGTVYYYRCGGGGPEFQLKTPPAQLPVNFAVAGDLGQTGWTKSTLDHIAQCQYDVHLLPGDLSYADFLQHRWDTFGEFVEPLASSRPWMVTEGNHEKERIPLFEEGFQSYNARWKMPFEESGSSSNLYYSFEVAGVHVIMLGSYADYDEYSEQYDWLKADLLKVDRSRTPWLIVLFHVPWYNSNHAHQGEGQRMMEAMEPLLYTAGVDIVLAGHVHAYERSKRVYNGRPDSCGAVHITIGDGGNREGLAQKYKDPQPEWSVFREASFGHGELKFVNASHAFWSWHRNDDDEPIKSDEVWISSLASSGCLVQKKHGFRKILMAP
ncbi:purple acid phosphatase 18 [Punica granatum]|uniref:Purple acid phosphatase n=1 Tax=Punica granatum TaxID=22663 RepID=A0A6P8E4V7_PUNGR|nr:purple acid phosphatase 18 [Punica granatum]